MNRKIKLLVLSSLLSITCGLTSCKNNKNKTSNENISEVNNSDSKNSEVKVADSVKVLPAPKEILEGSTINLDDYVKVVVDGKEGGKYIATSKTEDVATIGNDGKTVTFNGLGKFMIEVTDESGIKVGYFVGNVTSVTLNEVTEFVSKIKDNYTIYSYDASTKGITKSFPAYHTKDYFAYPYGFYYGKYDDKGSVYRGILKFVNNEIYDFKAGYLDDVHTLDTEDVTLGNMLRGETTNYYAFADFDASILSKFKTHKDSDGSEYLEAEFDPYISDSLFYQTLGVKLTPAYCDSVALQVGAFEGKDSLYVSCIYNGQVVNQYVLTDVGTTSYAPMESYLSDLANCKPKIDCTPIIDVIKDIVREGNYTITSETYLADDYYGTPISIPDAVEMYEPLHNMYSKGVSKFTEEGMLIVNLGPSDQDIENYTGVKAFGCIEKDSAVYLVEYDEETKTYSSTEEIKNEKGNSYTQYEDYYSGLGKVNLSTFSEFVILDYYEFVQAYSFTIKPDSVNGSDNLRALTTLVNPTVAMIMFPTELNDNGFEAGSAGEGIIRLNADGGFSFYYYTSRTSTDAYGKNIEFRICMEYTVSDIGTTNIEEYEGL